MLYIHRLILHFNRLFHGDDVHADPRAARRHHGRHLLQRQAGHPLKKARQFRVLLKLLAVHIGKLRAARHKHRQHILLFVRGVFPVVFEDADHAHLIQQFFQRFCILAGRLHELRQRHRLAHLHFEGYLGHFIRHHAGEAPVFRVVRRHLMADTVGDLLPELQNQLAGYFGFLRIVFSHFLLLSHTRQAITSLRSQAAHWSIPSPVFAQIGITCAFGLRRRMYSRHLSRSKSK